jgi:glycosyltransferase involved in cell wall biosynthesis
MRILILITKSNWGGAQKYVYELATSLPKESYEVKVMAGSEGPLTRKLWDAGIHAAGDLGIGRDVNAWQDFKAFWTLLSFLRKDRPDVLHLNSSKIGGLGALAGRLAGVKRVIFTVHGWAFNEDRPILQKIVIRFIYWFTIILSHQTILVSEAARRQVRNWPFIQDKLVVIHNGIIKETGFSKANARLELLRLRPELKKAIGNSSENNTVLVGTVAELHRIKGYEYGIRAIAECVRKFHTRKKIVYAIISDGEERQNLETLIKELGMEENILLLGHIESASQYMNAFDIFLLSSLSEGLGYVILEAGANSVPVVATAVGGIPEIVDDMKSGILVQPRKSSEIADAIEFYVDHPDTARAYAKVLNEKVLKDFSLKKMVSETEEVYAK